MPKTVVVAFTSTSTAHIFGFSIEIEESYAFSVSPAYIFFLYVRGPAWYDVSAAKSVVHCKFGLISEHD